MSSSSRLFRFNVPKPAWLNSANTRTAGVYLAGALVRFFPRNLLRLAHFSFFHVIYVCVLDISKS